MVLSIRIFNGEVRTCLSTLKHRFDLIFSIKQAQPSLWINFVKNNFILFLYYSAFTFFIVRIVCGSKEFQNFLASVNEEKLWNAVLDTLWLKMLNWKKNSLKKSDLNIISYLSIQLLSPLVQEKLEWQTNTKMRFLVDTISKVALQLNCTNQVSTIYLNSIFLYKSVSNQNEMSKLY